MTIIGKSDKQIKYASDVLPSVLEKLTNDINSFKSNINDYNDGTVLDEREIGVVKKLKNTLKNEEYLMSILESNIEIAASIILDIHEFSESIHISSYSKYTDALEALKLETVQLS